MLRDGLGHRPGLYLGQDLSFCLEPVLTVMPLLAAVLLEEVVGTAGDQLVKPPIIQKLNLRT